MAKEYVFTGQDREFGLTITINTPENWEKWKNMAPTFLENLQLAFKYAVFDCNKYLIRATPMLTGRLRGGWTALLNKHNIDYSAAFMDVTLVTGHNEPLSEEAIREGMALSSCIETENLISITNGVDYADYVETGTSRMEGQHFTLKTMYKSELIMANYIRSWAKKCSEKGEIVKPEQQEEVQA